MRRLVVCWVLLLAMLLPGATTYTDKTAWDLLWVDPASSVTFGTRGNNTAYREDRGGENLVVPSDAFSSSYKFESYWPGGAYFSAVLRGKDVSEYWIAPYDGMPVVSIILPDTNPFSFYTGPGESGFIGVVPSSGETRYDAKVSRIYKLNYGFSAYVEGDRTEDWTALIGTWDGVKWVSGDFGGYQFVTLTPGSWATGYSPGTMKLTFSQASISIIVTTSLGGSVPLTVSSEEEVDFSSYGEVSFLQFGGAESPFSVSKIEFY